MKQIIFGIVMLISFNACQSTKATSTKGHDFNFLVGEWIRTNEKTDRKTYESWKKLNNTTYLGCGFTIKNNDTIFQEHTTLVKENEKWIFKVKMNKKETKTTDFILTFSDKSSFIVENTQNDFPKIIKYWKNGTLLNAEISNDESNKVPFIFEKMK
ncbi:DUF6265 family protein [Empedobacter sedimenti]|uniref:DUF6265 family protein n=1 Tax=Empedobacter sedimenti TaxID=3042610 RepID=UPI0024A72E58|nr:DUF6265 family protein [Empedobacter sedimenti]